MEHVADVYPLTPTQEGVLFHTLRSGDPELYFEQVRATVRGEFCVERYRSAWEAVIDAHPALRTSFVWKGVKHPVRVVHRHVDAEWDVRDERAAPPDRDELDRMARERRLRGFDLQRAPLSRFLVVRLDDDTTHLAWDFHHVLLDGWSAASVFDQVLDRYEQPDRPVPVGPASPREHQQWLASQDSAEAEAHWAELLSGMDPSQRIEIGRPPGLGAADRSPTFRLGRLDRLLDPDLSADLTRAAAGHRVTLNTLVQAAWALVVERVADSDDVVFGAVSSGRPAEVDGMDTAIGMFLTTLPVRIDVGTDQPLGEWLGSVQRQQLDLLANQHLSLADLRPFTGADIGSDPFDSVVVFENYPRREATDGRDGGTGGAGLQVVDRSVFEQTHYDLTLMVMPGERIAVSFLYNAERFDETDIELLVDLFRGRLEAIARAPLASSLRPLELSAAADGSARHASAVVVAGPETALPALRMDELLERVRDESPAFVDENGRVVCTHGELRHQADAYAGRLEALRVGPGHVLAVASGRSPLLAAASMAAWACGATVLALEPDDPRNPDLVVRAGASVVIDADGHLAPTEGGADQGTPAGEAGPDGAVLVFTSGSTAAPKPVVLTHRGLVNRVSWQIGLHPFVGGEVAVAKTSLAFVDHLWELWGPLAAGSPVVAVEDPADLRRVMRILDRLPVRRLVLVPSVLAAMLELGDEAVAALGSLEWLTVSGERLTVDLARQVAEMLPGVHLLDFYGMSEATADVTWCDVSATDPDTWDPMGPPIGRPIDNLKLRLTDRHGRPALASAPGQIEVAGVGLAHGVASTAGISAGWYRTGDRGRWRADGQLDYLGRLDRQVKIRGVRVDPDQVEAVLRADASVVEAAVASVDGSLRAWVEPGPGFEETALRAELERRVVPQAVPPRLEICHEWPRTASGKLDRRALSSRAGTAPMSDPALPGWSTGSRTRRRPTRAESEMIELWEEVLQPDEEISPDDDFFELGGDSLAALRLFSRIDKHYGVELALAQVFDAPTPAAMVGLLDRGSGGRILILADDGDALAGRLASSARPHVARPDDPDLDEIVDRWSADTDGEPVTIVAHGPDAGAAAVGLVPRFRSAGTKVGLLALVAAGDLDAPARLDGHRPSDTLPGPETIVRFEPAEAPGRVPIFTSPDTRERLRSRSSFDGWAAAPAETVLVPGTPATVLHEPSVSWLSQLLLARIDDSDEADHLVPISHSENVPPERTLYAVHGEFGNVVGYRDLAVALGDDWSVVGVQASGVQGVEPLHDTIEEMASAYLEQILRRQPDGPYLIGGYSAGGTVAMEMVRQLEEAGRPVAALVWFDHFRHGAVEAQSTVERLVHLGRYRLGALRRQGRAELEAGRTRRRVRRLAEQVTATREDWWWQITALAADRAEAESIRAELLRANTSQARHRYEHPLVSSPIVLYEAEEIDAGRRPDRGWDDNEYAIERIPVPGDHSSVLAEPHVRAIADDLRRRYGA